VLFSLCPELGPRDSTACSPIFWISSGESILMYQTLLTNDLEKDMQKIHTPEGQKTNVSKTWTSETS